VSSLAPGILIAVVANLRAEAPGTTLSLLQRSVLQQVTSIRAGDIDIGLVHVTRDLALEVPDLRTVTIASGPRMIVVPDAHPLAAGRTVNLSQASSEPFVLPSGDSRGGYRLSVEVACRRYGFVPRLAAQADSVATMLELVALGAGVALVPWFTAARLPPGVSARPLQDEEVELTALSGAQPPEAAGALVRATRRAVRELD
jgi:DNA-binding transcriptional LysR family regulator